MVGLTFAVALNALDEERKIVIDLYEAAPELTEIGAGINVWPRSWQILKQIGLEEALIPLFDHYPDLERRKASVLIPVITEADRTFLSGIIFGVRKADQKNGFKIHDVTNNGTNPTFSVSGSTC